MTHSRRSIILRFLIISLVFMPQKKSCAQDGYNIAVLDHVATGISETEALVLSETLRSYVSKILKSRQYLSVQEFDRYIEIMERTQMDKIFDEFDIQNVGCVDDTCAVEFGKMLQVDRIVIGSVGRIGNTFTFSSRIVDVESSKTTNVALRRHRGIIDDLAGSVVQDIANELLKMDSDWENKELISIDGFPEKAIVYIDDKFFDETPVNNKLIAKGLHSIRILSGGYEKFTKNINVELGNPVELYYELEEITPWRTISKSLVFPGSGQRYAGHGIKGNFISVLQAATIACVVGSSFMYSDARDRYNEANNDYLNLQSSSKEDFDRAYKKVDDTYNDADSSEKLYLISIGAALGVYVWNIIDASFTKPEMEINQQRFSLDINPFSDGAHSGIYLRMRY